MEIKVIKNKEEYEEALKMVESLVAQDPDPESVEGEKLSLLATLIQDYESEMFPESLPDPIDAILFRMEQQNLKPRDLVPYIGSRSKVSEVLARKRSLTLSMMRALHAGLGIPAKVLLNESSELNDNDVVWDRFPVKEMTRRGYFEDKSENTGITDLMSSFFQPLGSPTEFVAMLRKTHYIRSLRSMDKQALIAWSGYIVKKANQIKYTNKFKKGTVNLDFMQKVARLSKNPNGVELVQDFLKEYGIGFIVEPRFPQTYLDGAAIMMNKEHPIIGLTVRHDRLDNFWFNLMHELAHIALHYDQAINLFYDDLDEVDVNSSQEEEADKLAREALVPDSKWAVSPAKLLLTQEAAQDLANELDIHVSIVVGRMRYEGKRYRYLNSLVGQDEVRKHFQDIDWSSYV